MSCDECGRAGVRRFAAIDIGTVTCRMLVADVGEDGRIQELDREYRIVNLGEDVDKTGMLKPEAIARALDAVDAFLGVLDGYRDGHDVAVSAVATSASRDAGNAQDFIDALERRGVRLLVIPGTREAGLSFRGASSDYGGERLLVVDVGGGSTEVIAGIVGDDPSDVRSFDIGCRRVTERFLRADPPDPRELAIAREWVQAQMRPFFDGVHAKGFEAQRMVAVAGTATTAVSVREGMESYDSARVHGARVTRGELDDVYGRLASVALPERRDVPGLDPGRAPVIVAGMLILQEVLACAGLDAFSVSEHDILHGIILAAAEGSL